MKIILAPAKKMIAGNDDFAYRDLPVFLNRTQVLLDEMRSLDEAGLKKLWKCSDSLVKQNAERIRNMDLHEGLSPAVFSYVGLAYQHLAAGAMTEEQLEYLQEHLRILSGFYGVLKPFDGVTPYRLEMQAVMPETGSLYAYWGDSLYEEVTDEDRIIVDLASKEYSDAVRPHLKEGDRMITVVFAEEAKGKIVSKGTMAKMARGEMVWWMAENRITDPVRMTEFESGYAYSEEHSDGNTYVFLKKR